MVIVGIIAGTAVVSMTSMTGNLSAMAATQLHRDMTFARQRAVATGTRSWVQLDTESWTVRVDDPDTPGWALSDVLTDPATGGTFVQSVNTGRFLGVTITLIDFDGADDWIGFDWLGRPLTKDDPPTTPLVDGDGSITFSGGEQITIDKDTGHIVFVPAP